MPKAWLDMRNNSNRIPLVYDHSLLVYYGLEDFILLECEKGISELQAQNLLPELSFVARKIGWRVDWLVQFNWLNDQCV